ncbi:hypothetical protein Gpo141_00010592 [Globisporangium polare]
MHALQELKPMSVQPTVRRPEAAQITGAVKQIACVRVSSSRTEGYTVEIYHIAPSTSNSRIPASGDPQGQEVRSSTLSSQPDARIERSYADFLGLQLQLQHRVHVAHRTIPCAFCSEVSSIAKWGGVRSSPLAMLAMTEDELVEIFTAFVNELLVLTRTQFPATRRGPCSAHERVPLMLHEFLVKE